MQQLRRVWGGYVSKGGGEKANRFQPSAWIARNPPAPRSVRGHRPWLTTPAAAPPHRTNQPAEPSLSSAPIRVSASAQPLQDQGFLEVSTWLSNRVSATTTTSSRSAATPGTASSASPGASCPSASAIGRMGSDQWELVLRTTATSSRPATRAGGSRTAPEPARQSPPRCGRLARSVHQHTKQGPLFDADPGSRLRAD